MDRTPRAALNMGLVDRAIRAVLGIVLFVAWFVIAMPWLVGAVLALVGAVLRVTAVAGSCPLYRMIGVSTRAPHGPT